MTQTSAPVVEQTRRRFGMSHLNLVISLVALIATILGTVAAWLALKPAGNPSALPTNGSTMTAVAGAATGSPSSPAAPGAQLTYLNTLTPEKGAANLASPLPPELRKRTDLQHAIVIRCNSGDAQILPEIRYEVRGAYSTLQGAFEPYLESGQRFGMELIVYADPAAANVVSTSAPSSRVDGYPGDVRPLIAAIDDVYYVRIRVRCTDRSGFVILRDAAFVA
ncbi:MAG: hypothetical protein HOV79_12150 [Hamadaea sp.]|nr:hypothetical protein [Hamadaea sp.]